MTCFECGQGQLEPSKVSVSGNRCGESFTVEIDGFRCQVCGFQTMDSEQSAEFTRLVSDAYREKHGLLTSAEIKARRMRLGMSQQEFAIYLGPGIASVKRWEAGQVQDRAMDELIRLKTDPEAARRNLKELEAQVPERCILSVGAMGGVSIELSLPVAEQQYRRVPSIRLDRSGLLADEFDDERCWAAA